MKIELKNIKYAEFASHETHCYTATVYIDGKKVATVENSGHGGSDMIDPWTVGERIDEYAKTLPHALLDNTTDPDTGKPYEVEHNFETIFGDLVNKYLLTRDLKRAMSKKLVFTKPGNPGIWTINAKSKTGVARALEAFANKPEWKGRTILNLLPIDEALKIWSAE